MDKERFKTACEKINNQNHMHNSIGTLSEKTLHAVLKYYFEPDFTNHEIKVGNHVADIVKDNEIIEIQTRSFDKLRKKLEIFLEITKVTIVYPIPYLKWLIWIDNKTGEITKKRKSPKIGSIYEIFHELYKIKPFLRNKNLRLCIVLLNIEEYRNLDGWSEDKKKGSSRYERIPVDVIHELYINNENEYAKLIPSDLLENFTVKDFKKASKLSLYNSGLVLNILYSLGVVERIAKKGNAFIYKRVNNN